MDMRRVNISVLLFIGLLAGLVGLWGPAGAQAANDWRTNGTQPPRQAFALCGSGHFDKHTDACRTGSITTMPYGHDGTTYLTFDDPIGAFGTTTLTLEFGTVNYQGIETVSCVVKDPVSPTDIGAWDTVGGWLRFGCGQVLWLTTGDYIVKAYMDHYVVASLNFSVIAPDPHATLKLCIDAHNVACAAPGSAFIPFGGEAAEYVAYTWPHMPPRLPGDNGLTVHLGFSEIVAGKVKPEFCGVILTTAGLSELRTLASLLSGCSNSISPVTGVLTRGTYLMTGYTLETFDPSVVSQARLVFSVR